MQFFQKLMRRGSLLFGLTFSLLLLAAVACGGTAATPAVIEKQVVVVKEVEKEVVKEVLVVVTPTPMARPAQAKVAGRIIGIAGEEPHTFDSHAMRGGVVGSYSRSVVESLTGRDKDFKLVGVLADTWDISPNGLVWTFHLRKGVKLHNGDDYNADEHMANWERIQDATIYVNRGNINRYSNVEKVDDFTVRYTADKFDVRLRFSAPPPNVSCATTIKANGWTVDDMQSRACNTGPYRFVDKSTKEWVDMEAFPDYWGNKVNNGLGYFGRPVTIAEYRLLFVPEELTKFALLKTGRAEIVQQMGPGILRDVEDDPALTWGADSWKDLNADFGCHPEQVDVPNLPYCSTTDFMGDNGWKVRRAFALAVDTEAIAGIYGTMGLDRSIYHPDQQGANTKNVTPYPYDPEKAKELMKDAGYPNCFSLKLTSTKGRLPRIPEMMEAFGGYLQTNLGCDIKINEVDYRLWLNTLNTSVAPIADGMIWGMNGGGSTASDAWVNVEHRRCNLGSYTNWGDPTLDELCYRTGGEPDYDKRTKLLEELGDYLYDTIPAVPLMMYATGIAWNKERVDIQDLPPSFQGFIYLPSVKILGDWER